MIGSGEKICGRVVADTEPIEPAARRALPADGSDRPLLSTEDGGETPPGGNARRCRSCWLCRFGVSWRTPHRAAPA